MTASPFSDDKPSTSLSSATRSAVVKFAILLVGLVACGVGLLSYRAFHGSGAWISPSPVHPRWAVDMVATGFTDVGQDFRVHDFASSPFQPKYVCDLYWEGLHWPGEIHWSRDGTVAAVTVGFDGHPGHFYGCAYDFL